MLQVISKIPGFISYVSQDDILKIIKEKEFTLLDIILNLGFKFTPENAIRCIKHLPFWQTNMDMPSGDYMEVLNENFSKSHCKIIVKIIKSTPEIEKFLGPKNFKIDEEVFYNLKYVEDDIVFLHQYGIRVPDNIWNSRYYANRYIKILKMGGYVVDENYDIKYLGYMEAFFNNCGKGDILLSGDPIISVNHNRLIFLLTLFKWLKLPRRMALLICYFEYI